MIICHGLEPSISWHTRTGKERWQVNFQWTSSVRTGIQITNMTAYWWPIGESFLTENEKDK